MVRQTRAKQERVIEAVRRNLEGDAAVEFIHSSGYAMTVAGIARHLRTMGGRGRILEVIEAGKSNFDILAECFPDEDFTTLQPEAPSQGELFAKEPFSSVPLPVVPPEAAPFETTKLTIRVPSDLYEAIRLAARAEGKSRTDLVVEILTAALSRMPMPPEEETRESAD